MRKSDREITEYQELLDVIRKCDICRIAVNTGDYPYLIPLNFGMEQTEGQLYFYFHSATEGRKLDLFRKDCRVGFEMDCGCRLETDYEKSNCTMRYECVIGTGTIEILPDSEKRHGLSVLLSHYPIRPEFQIDERLLLITAVYRLRVESMTGKRH